MSDSFRSIPQVISDVGFDFDWDEKKVWALDAPTTEIPIDMLRWHFSVPFLRTEHGYYDLTPFEVLNEPSKHVAETLRVEKADLKYPIDIMLQNGRWVILDGLHRLMKAHRLGLPCVQVRKIPRTEIEKIKK